MPRRGQRGQVLVPGDENCSHRCEQIMNRECREDGDAEEIDIDEVEEEEFNQGTEFIKRAPSAHSVPSSAAEEVFPPSGCYRSFVTTVPRVSGVSLPSPGGCLSLLIGLFMN
uniref:Uncharacterized protein n=1 Tax=Setaria digitata TaxID=48799 RepID=A0A915PQX9_9BILA